ncbi:unnamed protein product [Rotaria sordida]|uniref:Caspase family p20 domain-containing protein n=1 Tax=Rotaria sordida TaxID=392033 RepID=A0A819PB61_9BILA|nr:unnamed protein product [Rotaria sordida]
MTGITTNTRIWPRRKLALVIGISDYDVEEQLENAENDAIDMSSVLKRIGFIIDKPKLNLKCKDMEVVLTKFKYSINSEDMVVFYFAGHGLQWEDQNFLLPKDYVHNKDTTLQNRAIHVQSYLNAFNGQNPFATIFLLDCCRFNYQRNHELTKAIAVRGSFIDRGSVDNLNTNSNDESLVAFACAPGAAAAEKLKTRQERNGLFTKHLLKHIVTRDQDIITILEAVIKGVREESNRLQKPECTSSLTRKIFLHTQVLRK